MSINPWLLGLVVAIGSLIGGRLAIPNDYLGGYILFGICNGLAVGLVVGLTRTIRALLSGGPIRFT
jgi:hypothetical protein